MMPKSKWGSSSGASGGSIPSESWRLLWRLIFIIAGPALLAPPASSSATRARNSAFSFLNHTDSFQSRRAEAIVRLVLHLLAGSPIVLQFAKHGVHHVSQVVVGRLKLLNDLLVVLIWAKIIDEKIICDFMESMEHV
jgi:hypothetical protein